MSDNSDCCFVDALLQPGTGFFVRALSYAALGFRDRTHTLEIGGFESQRQQQQQQRQVQHDAPQQQPQQQPALPAEDAVAAYLGLLFPDPVLARDAETEQRRYRARGLTAAELRSIFLRERAASDPKRAQPPAAATGSLATAAAKKPQQLQQQQQQQQQQQKQQQHRQQQEQQEETAGDADGFALDDLDDAFADNDALEHLALRSLDKSTSGVIEVPPEARLGASKRLSTSDLLMKSAIPSGRTTPMSTLTLPQYQQLSADLLSPPHTSSNTADSAESDLGELDDIEDL